MGRDYNKQIMKSQWIEHKGRRIFFADYSGFGSDSQALYREVEQAVDVIAAEPRRSVLVLSDFSNTVETMKNLDTVRQLIRRSNFAVSKRALLGIGGIRRIFLTTFASVTGGTQIQIFEDRASALDWLVSS